VASRCAVCGDSGWAFVEAAPHAAATVACCLCLEGEKRKAAQVGMGRRPKSMDECMSADCIAALFPEGTAQAAQQAARERLAATGLPPVCREWTLVSYREVVVAGDKDLARFGHWAEGWIGNADRPDVVLYGTKGTGKTGLAVAMGRGAFDQGVTLRFITARDLMLQFRESMRDAGDGERAVDEAFLAPQVLVLDEFGGTALTDYQRDTLTALIDARQKARRQTLLTLNVEGGLLAEEVQAQARELLGGRLSDRLVEQAVWWAMVGPSRRRPRTRVRAQAGGDRAGR
jgi:DNA replication protein DnaC